MDNIKKDNRGGKRAGAGRPVGSRSTITLDGLLGEVERQFGKPYHEVLIEDFRKANGGNDHNLTMKYHNMLVNKLYATLSKVEVSEDTDQVDMKRNAFVDALKTLTVISDSIEKGNKHE